ncbi:MAG: hypothetical protein AAF624_08550 [Bacteroidota bacterium]
MRYRFHHLVALALAMLGLGPLATVPASAGPASLVSTTVERTPVVPANTTYAWPRFRVRVQQDADRYTRRLAYALGLTRRQEAAVYDLLVGRTLRSAQEHGRRSVYPFPRRAAERTRTGRRFWNRTDDRIARVLTSRQRRTFNRHTYDHFFYDDYDRWGQRDRYDSWDRRDDRRDDRRRDRRRDGRG